MMRVGVVGLGYGDSPLAEALLRAGHQVVRVGEHSRDRGAVPRLPAPRVPGLPGPGPRPTPPQEALERANRSNLMTHPEPDLTHAPRAEPAARP